MIEIFWIAIPGLALLSFILGRQRALVLNEGGRTELHSLPSHYGGYVALWAVLPALGLLCLWLLAGEMLVEAWALGQLESSGLLAEGQDARRVHREVLSARDQLESIGGSAHGAAHVYLEAALVRTERVLRLAVASLIAVFGTLGLLQGHHRVAPTLRARERMEGALHLALLACSIVAILTTLGIVLSLLFEALRFFQIISPLEFFLGTEWSPQTALRPDQVGSSGAFGAIPIFAGTLLITLIAMSISLPVGLMSAIHLSFYASNSARSWIKPLLEIIAGIPTVVWGSFAALTLAPSIRGFGEDLGLDVASESALAAGLAMGVMIIPFVSSLSDDALTAVPASLRDGSLAMGATLSETIRRVILPAALPGIVGAFLLAVSRAIGETMIVVMAAGLAANLTANPFEAVTTVTVQIVSLLMGDQEFDSAKTLAAFALGLTLFFVTLGLNLIALMTVRRFREQYD